MSKSGLRAKMAALALAAASAGLLGFSAHADDTELFTQPPGTPQPPPNVMLLLDNSANWSRAAQAWPGGIDQGQSEVRAIKTVVGSMTKKAAVGVAMHAASGSTNGGYIRMGARDMSVLANKTALMDMMDHIYGNINAPSEKISQAQRETSAAFFELYRYFSGASNFYNGASLDGNSDYAGNANAGTTNMGGLVNGFAYPSSSGGTYLSPLSGTNACARNYIIFIANNANGNWTKGSQSYDGLSAGTKINLPDTTAADDWTDEWARYMNVTGAVTPSADVNGKIITYVIDVFNAQQNTSYSAMLKSVAQQGGGRYFQANNEAQIVDAINAIFDEIQAVNSVFASVSLPVSVNVRGTNLNQVYLGVFRPDGSAAPNWPGNLKQYKLGLAADGGLQMVDKNGTEALASSGYFQAGATSYWSAANNYWTFDPDGSVSDPDSDAPDGPLVERGGAAQMARWDIVSDTRKLSSARKIITHLGASPGSPVSLTNGSGVPLAAHTFATANAGLTTGMFTGAASAGERDDIINWIRGADLNGDYTTSVDLDGMRPLAHGDVVHSRPAVINYNRYGDDDDVAIYYGANDGLLRAIQGGQNATPGNGRPTGGAEYWAFAAEDFFDSFKRMKDNAPVINWSGSTGTSLTLTGKLAAGSPVVSIDPAVAGLSVGMGVTGTGVPGSTTTSAVAMYPSITISANAGSTGSATPLEIVMGTETVGTVNGSATLSVGSIPAWLLAVPIVDRPNISVSGLGIAPNSKIFKVDAIGGHEMTQAATGNLTGAPLSFEKSVNGYAIMSGAFGSQHAFFPNGYTPVQAGVGFEYRTIGGSARYPLGTLVTSAPATIAAWTVSSTPGSTLPNTKVIAFGSPLASKQTKNAVQTISFTAGSATTTGAVPLTMLVATHGFSKGLLLTDAAGIPKMCGASLVYVEAASGASANITLKRDNTAAACSFTFAKKEAVVARQKSVANADLLGGNSAFPVNPIVSADSTLMQTAAPAVGWVVRTSAGSALGTIDAIGTMPTLVMGANTTASSGSGGDAMLFGFDTTGDLLNGSSVIANIPGGFAGLVATGMSVTSSSGLIPGGTLVNGAVTAGITLNQPATATAGSVSAKFYLGVTGNTVSGSNVIALPALDGSLATMASAGQSVTGLGVPIGATLSAKSPSTSFVTLSSSATASGLQSLTFTTTASASGGPKPYFFDGPIGVWRDEALVDGRIVASDGDKAWIFAPMRRGGRKIYAFDVSDPKLPKLMWKKGCTDAGVCDAGFEDLGQTWSMPQPVEMSIENSGGTVEQRPVLVFGGGYDADYEDQDPIPASATRNMGRGVWFVDAETGEPIRVFKGTGVANPAGVSSLTGKSWNMTGSQAAGAAAMTCAIPADASSLTRDPVTGYTLPSFRSYFADTCGQIWRIDTSSPNPDHWIVTRLASFGISQAIASGETDPDLLDQARRKFLFAPDVVYGGKDNNGLFHYVLIGSGDREHPFQGYGDLLNPTAKAAKNRFYMVKDYNVDGVYYRYDPLDMDAIAPHNKTLIAPPGVSFDTDGDGTAESIYAGGFPLTEAAIYDATADLVQLGTAAQQASAMEAMIGGSAGGVYQGWMIKLEDGEKVVGGATSSAGYVYFGTNKPKTVSAVCSTNLGEARLYQVGIKSAGTPPPSPYTHPTSASARYSVIPGGGLPPTPVPVSVMIDGEFKEGVLSGTTVKQPDETAMGSRIRVFSRKTVDR